MTTTFPQLELRGGPYAGEVTGGSVIDHETIDSFLFFPDSVIVKGSEGSAVYMIHEEEKKVDIEDGDKVHTVIDRVRFAAFSHMG